MNKRIQCTILALFLSAALALPSFAAAGPGSQRSNEEWERLRDNLLEWEEIPGLVEEYNPKYTEELASYRKREEYRKSASDLNRTYADMAEELEDQAREAESEYAGQIAAASLRLQAEQVREQSLTNTDDSRTAKLAMDELLITQKRTVRELFVSYYEAEAACKNNKAEIERLKQEEGLAEIKYRAKAITKEEVTAAKDSVRNEENRTEKLEIAKKNAYRELILSCGWSYDAEAKIGPLPEEASLHLSGEQEKADRVTVLENSILLKKDRIRLENAVTLYGEGEVKKKQEKLLAEDTETVKETYESVLKELRDAENSLAEAGKTLEKKNKLLDMAKKQNASGSLSKAALRQKQDDRDRAEESVKAAFFALYRARIHYDSIMEGSTL